MTIAEIVALAFASMVWPTLIGVVVVALASPAPVRLLSFFVSASLLTTIGIGLVVVFVLRGSSLFSGSKPTFGPVVDLVAGGVALLTAYVVERRRRLSPRPRAKPSLPGWMVTALSHGAPLVFLLGIVLNVFPGVFPLVALKDIAQLDYSPAASVALIAGFYLIMFMPAEIPLGSYVVVPDRTSAAVAGFNAWLARNTRAIAAVILAVVGAYLIVRGIVSLVFGGS
jgi:Sap, sulfolipid-1-addressing protein